ncbi:uncharacterized protein EKO05_0000174 [Ascochyta rabiei]|uniref:DNA binding n=1 Tax=Didymella rabiei TaxID=5454 RepID=A0A163C9A7_DIDRA|nr:uncharacterized protein EKO05_0000174 [Ascochyta rabiei]KZM22297.1 DNA binding [Ascochyta rabiei]UPX09485.1 hypothetical protein EKO05_0000174 [Ascochyta rabiei]
MAGGSKRGGFRGAGTGGYKRGYTKKRSPNDEDEAPRASKKSKGDEDEEEDTAPLVPKLQIDDDNNPFVAINNSSKRRVTVSDFKGTTLISIREYWTNEGGELKPGKKGISLSVEQYNALLAAAPILESVLRKKDIEVARPDYEAKLDATAPVEEAKEGQQTTAKADDDDNDHEGDDKEE